MSEKVVKLREPIQFGSETITELKFKKPKAKHFRKLSTSDGMDATLTLASKLCDQTPSVLDELSVDDMAEVIEVIDGFLPDSLKTGSKR